MKALRLAALALACTMPLLAAAQWVYLDKSGRKVFSDQVPPPDVTPDRIIRQPGVKAAAVPAAEAAPAAAPAVATGSAARTSGSDKTLEAKKKQGEAAEAAKKKEQEEKVAQARSEN